MAFSFEILFFGITAGIAVILAIMMLAVRSPIHSALCLVGVMVMLDVNYLMLQAYFLAAVQVVVYAGAVMVLFLYVIMFFYKPGKVDIYRRESQYAYTAGAIILSTALLVAIVISMFLTGAPQDSSYQVTTSTANSDLLPGANIATTPLTPDTDNENQKHNPERVGVLLYTNYLLPFELTSLLLLAAMVGAVVLAKRSPGKENDENGGVPNA
jgi:NADH-quinone oxidoreductase subunit J